MNIQALKKHFRKGKANAYAWPGGYPLFYLCCDGESLCPACVTKERKLIFRSTHEQLKDGWQVDAVDVNWEDAHMYCAHCNKRIESAYAESEAE